MQLWNPRFKITLQCSLLFLSIFAIYFISLDYGFIWDDFTYIVNSDALNNPTGLLQLWTTHIIADFWPLSYSLFWLQKQLYGNSTFGFHFVNLLLFSIAALLIFCLLKKLKFKSAFLIALIYAVHPMNVEAAVWIFQAKTNLANALGLGSFIFWIDFVDSKKSKRSYFLAFIFIILSFLAKISLVMLPVLIFLYLYLKRPDFKLIKSIILCVPFFAASLVIGLVNVFWDSNAFQVPGSEIILEPDKWFRFALVGKTFLFYLTKTFWPWPLMFAYPRWRVDLSSFETFVPSVILLLCLGYVIWKIFNRQRISLILAGFFVSFLILFPALGVSEIYFMRFSFVAEHWLTIGLIGFVAGICELLYSNKFLQYLLWLAVPCFGIMTFKYTQDYSSEKKLLEASLEKNPISILPHNILGLIFKNENNLDQAIQHFQKSIEIQPNAQSYFNLASIFEAADKVELAKFNYLKALELNPYIPKTYINLGVLHAKMNDGVTAIKYFKKALEIDPGDANTYYNIGYVYEYSSRKAEALAWFQKALRLQPDNGIFLNAIKRVTQH